MKLIGFLVIFCLGYAFGFHIPVPDEYIVGGVQANIQKFPYQLSLRINGRHMCGGSIIGSQWVLTAAHCLISVQASAVSLRAGSSVSTSGGELVQATQIYTHPQFNAQNGDYDIALISVSTAFAGTNIGAIALPSVGTPIPIGSAATISGWGLTSASESINPTQLQSVSVTILQQSICIQDYAAFGGVDNMMFCAGQTGHDSCQGDSGGPIVVGSVQVGVVSGGVGCANPKYPGLYTNAADATIRTWITKTAGI